MCKFWIDYVAFLGHVVSKEGIRVDPTKIDGICDSDTPIFINDIRSFTRLEIYYRCLIEGFYYCIPFYLIDSLGCSLCVVKGV